MISSNIYTFIETNATINFITFLPDIILYQIIMKIIDEIIYSVS